MLFPSAKEETGILSLFTSSALTRLACVLRCAIVLSDDFLPSLAPSWHARSSVSPHASDSSSLHRRWQHSLHSVNKCVGVGACTFAIMRMPTAKELALERPSGLRMVEELHPIHHHPAHNAHAAAGRLLLRFLH